MDTQITTTLPIALRKHVPAVVEDRGLLGNPDQAWSWEPSGDFSKKDLEIYASGGNSTTRQTYSGQWDHGEFY
jgi:hypothetical protein